MLSRSAVRLTMSVLGVAFTFAGTAYAQATKNVINATTITTYPPFAFKDAKSNQLLGFDIDTLNAIAAKMGAEVNWIETTFDQQISFSALKTKRADINGSAMTDTPERRASVNFLDYVYEVQFFYTLRGNAGQFTNAEALCGKRVAITRSSGIMNDAVVKWSEENCARAGRPEVIVMGSENNSQSQQMINQGRADASLSGAGALAYQNTLEGGRYVTLGKAVIKFMYGMAFRKDDPQFAQALKTALAALIADGTYTKLLRKWNLTDDASIHKPMINGSP